MSVSQGTKNLKFMQRASARTGTSTATEPTRKLLPGEASAQWTLPVAAQPVVAKGKGKSAMKIVYERSYMPFLLGDEAENAEAGPSRPSGRVQFGKKAEEVKPPVIEDTTEEESAQPRKEGKQRFRVRQVEEDDSATLPPQPDSRGFLKPTGFDDLDLPSPPIKRKTNAEDDAEVILDGARKKRSKNKKEKKGKNRPSEGKPQQDVGDDEDKEAQAFLDEVMNELRED